MPFLCRAIQTATPPEAVWSGRVGQVLPALHVARGGTSELPGRAQMLSETRVPVTLRPHNIPGQFGARRSANPAHEKCQKRCRLRSVRFVFECVKKRPPARRGAGSAWARGITSERWRLSMDGLRRDSSSGSWDASRVWVSGFRPREFTRIKPDQDGTAGRSRTRYSKSMTFMLMCHFWPFPG